VGVARATDSAGLGIVLIPGLFIGLGLAGLPLTGGALAKLAVKDPLGYGMAGALATLASSGTALLMLHFLRRLALTASAVSSKRALTGLVVPWMAMALASVAVPWILYPVVGIGSLSEAIAAAMLWKALWPVLFGALLAVGLHRWGHKLPHIPAGDIVIGGGVLTRVAAFCGEAMERVDALLRQWQIAVWSLVVVAILLAVAMMASG
jgi:multicomponent Na+:H+ antiporter subunit A